MVRFAGLPAAFVLLCSFAVPAPIAAQVASAPSPPRSAVEHRPAALVPLYASFVTLQVLDVHSTSSALGRGAVEGNPLMKGLAANEVGLLAIKAAGSAGVILASERMWKRNKAAAVIFMIVSNSAMGWVVQHNYRAAR
jgi:hypothetical protein